jgi:acetylglutamate kinase
MTIDPANLAKAETLTEALPYLQRYAGKTFVVKYGGHAMGDASLARDFADDVVLLKAVGINPVVVHGGGPQIGAMLKKLGVESEFVDGLRVTDAETAKIAEMVLSGAINKELVGWINAAGGKALGISGKDGGFVTATKVQRTQKDPDSHIERNIDLGFVGEPTTVDRSIIDTISAAGMIPVIAPIGVGADGHTYNINADTMAGAIASALGASRLFLLTDVAGVLNKSGELLTDLDPAAIAAKGGHDQRRNDPQNPDLRRCGRIWRGCGGYPRWPHQPCHAHRNVYCKRRRDAYSQVNRDPRCFRQLIQRAASANRFDTYFRRIPCFSRLFP